jgi:ABC-2 type transport system ATP-binding protein
VVGIKHESMRKGQTSHKKEHNTRMCFPLKPVFTRDKGGLPNFMDEPTAGLDVGAREAMLDILREYMEEEPERSILISSHISSDLEHLCDDIYVIHKGKIVLHEEMDTILEKYAVLKVSEAQYQAVDKSYILKEKKENFGISCLTNEKQYYIENYPEIVVESGSLDQVILMLTGGER